MSRRLLLVARGLDAVGCGREVLQTARHLRVLGYDVHVAFTSRPAGVAAALAADDMTVLALSGRPQPSGGSVAGMARAVATLRPHLVMSWGWSAMRITAAAMLPARLRHHPRWLAVLARPRLPKTRSDRLLTGRLLQSADRILAATEATAASCRAFGASSACVQLAPPGIGVLPPPQLTREDMAKQLGLPVHTTWTLCVAPRVARSRLERLVWAADQLDVVLRGLTHIAIGYGPLGPQIARRARAQEAAARLRLIDHCSIITDLLAHVRLVWQTGEVAGGGALLDALAAGVPTVAVASDAAQTFIDDGVTGRIAPADPQSELPRHALPLLEDDALHAELAAASRLRAQATFPLEPALERQLAAIRELTD